MSLPSDIMPVTVNQISDIRVGDLVHMCVGELPDERYECWFLVFEIRRKGTLRPYAAVRDLGLFQEFGIYRITEGYRFYRTEDK